MALTVVRIFVFVFFKYAASILVGSLWFACRQHYEWNLQSLDLQQREAWKHVAKPHQLVEQIDKVNVSQFSSF